MKKTKILHILSSDRYSGAESVACTIIENLKNDYNISYCSPRGPIEYVLKEKGIHYIPMQNLSRKEIGKIIAKENPDIIHAHDFSASFKCASFRKHRKFFVHLHGNPLWLRKVCVKSLVSLFTMKRADSVFTVSPSIAKEYIFSKLVKTKVKCIGNPTSVKTILDRTIVRPSHKEYDICCVARLSEEKDPIKFLRVIDMVKADKSDVKAIWVGDGKMRQHIQQIIKSMNLQDNVALLGFKNNPYDYMAKSKIFLLTSKWEGYGLAAFEALTLGLPCVVSNVGGLPDIVDEECGHLCTEEKDYAESVINLLNDGRLYEKKSKASTLKAQKINNLDRYIQVIKDEYGGHHR